MEFSDAPLDMYANYDALAKKCFFQSGWRFMAWRWHPMPLVKDDEVDEIVEGSKLLKPSLPWPPRVAVILKACPRGPSSPMVCLTIEGPLVVPADADTTVADFTAPSHHVHYKVEVGAFTLLARVTVTSPRCLKDPQTYVAKTFEAYPDNKVAIREEEDLSSQGGEASMPNSEQVTTEVVVFEEREKDDPPSIAQIKKSPSKLLVKGDKCMKQPLAQQGDMRGQSLAQSKKGQKFCEDRHAMAGPYAGDDIEATVRQI
ncbi:hypothetical protein L7F22_036994 [Adiantum nelumboides]|nr:hypothetical protein [Adiantum nelumboides]